MNVQRRLLELGGTAGYRQLVAVAGRREVGKAVESGEIVRSGHGRYVLPGLDLAAREAHALGGVLSHTSAALSWGWALKTVPHRPHVTVPVKRKVRRRSPVELHRRDLMSEDVSEGRTSRDLTLEQCLRTLPFDEGLAVADSAVREGYPLSRLVAVVRGARGPGSASMRRVAGLADPAAANPFESVLRAICLEVDGLHVRPQVVIGPARVDLADEELRLVLEADSFAWHGDRRALRRDTLRYNRLVVEGWTVLRFAWEDVMFAAEGVRSTVELAVSRTYRRSNRAPWPSP